MVRPLILRSTFYPLISIPSQELQKKRSYKLPVYNWKGFLNLGGMPNIYLLLGGRLRRSFCGNPYTYWFLGYLFLSDAESLLSLEVLLDSPSLLVTTLSTIKLVGAKPH